VNRLATVAIVAAFAVFAERGAVADPITIRVAMPAPPSTPFNTHAITPWARDVERAAAGAIEVKVFTGTALADLRNSYDRTLNGVADVGYGPLGPISSQFPNTQVAELPFITHDVNEAGLALWGLYTSGILTDEYERVRVLALFHFPPSNIFSKKPIRRIESLQGMRLSVNGKMIGEVVKRLGASPVSIAPSEIYQSFARGLIDGVAASWAALATYKLDEEARFAVEAPLGAGMGYVVMNKESYARLPDVAKQAFDRNSGRLLVVRLGEAAAMTDAAGRERVAKAHPDSILTLDAKELERWRERARPLLDEWANTTPNGAAVLKAYLAEVEKMRTK